MSTNNQKTIYQWLKNVQFALLPGTCILCRQPSHRHRDLCLVCQAALPRIREPCRHCGLPLPQSHPEPPVCGTCLLQPPPFVRLVAPFCYSPPLPALIAAFKYDGRLVNGRVLAESLAACLHNRYGQAAMPAILAPVPLHRSRLRRRGFNQALELARRVSRLTAIPVAPRLLERHRDTPAQTGLGARERQRNLARAFTFKGDRRFVPGMTVALVDDVVTTTATVTALSRLLLRNGASEVHVWAVARTLV